MFKILFLSSKCFTSELICTNRVHPHYRSIAMASVSDIKVGLVDWFVSPISSYDRSDWMEIGEICDGQLDTATSTLGPQSSDQNITLFFSCSKLSFNFPWQHGIYVHIFYIFISKHRFPLFKSYYSLKLFIALNFSSQRVDYFIPNLLNL